MSAPLLSFRRTHSCAFANSSAIFFFITVCRLSSMRCACGVEGGVRTGRGGGVVCTTRAGLARTQHAGVARPARNRRKAAPDRRRAGRPRFRGQPVRKRAPSALGCLGSRFRPPRRPARTWASQHAELRLTQLSPADQLRKLAVSLPGLSLPLCRAVQRTSLSFSSVATGSEPTRFCTAGDGAAAAGLPKMRLNMPAARALPELPTQCHWLGILPRVARP